MDSHNPEEAFHNIYVVGDNHGSLVPFWNIISYARKGSVIISVGDFGVGFNRLETEMLYLTTLNKRLKNAGIHFYICRGNHDNPWYFSHSLSELNYEDYSNIHFVPDFSTIEVNGLRIGFIGGAVSVDRKLRVEDKDHWRDSIVTDSMNVNKLFDLDVLITHTAPDHFSPWKGDRGGIAMFLHKDPLLEQDLITESNLMYKYYSHVMGCSPNLKYIYFGHFHKSHITTHNGITVKCLDINEIEKL